MRPARVQKANSWVETGHQTERALRTEWRRRALTAQRNLPIYAGEAVPSRIRAPAYAHGFPLWKRRSRSPYCVRTGPSDTPPPVPAAEYQIGREWLWAEEVEIDRFAMPEV